MNCESPRFEARSVRIPLRTRFKHASAERHVSESLLVAASAYGSAGLGEGAPRDYVTGESLGEALAWLESLRPRISALRDVDDLRLFVESNRSELDRHPAAWCGLEMALLDAFARGSCLSVERHLGLGSARGTYGYTAVVSDEEGEALEAVLAKYLDHGFTDFKFKLRGDAAFDRARLERLCVLFEARGLAAPRIRLDANNLWAGRPDGAIAHLKQLKGLFWAIEEPVAPRAARELSRISVELDTVIILDESLTRLDDFDLYEGLDGCFAVNLRVSKMGGVLRSLEIIERLRDLGWPLIVGAQVGETSLLTRAALTVTAQARDLLVAQEGAYGTLLLEHDLVQPVLMFGAGGRLTVDNMGPGWGLNFQTLEKGDKLENLDL